MSQPVTKSDVHAMFGRAVRAAEKIGKDMTGVVLVEGSSTYGQSWKMVRVGEHGAHRDVVAPYGFLGMTRRDACATLYAYATAWDFAAEKPMTF